MWGFKFKPGKTRDGQPVHILITWSYAFKGAE